MTKARARDKAHALTEIAAKDAALATPAPNGATSPPANVDQGLSLEAWLDLFHADRERRGHTSVDDDRGRLKKWVLPRLSPPLGKRPMKSIQKVDLEALVEDLDERVLAEELSWKTAVNAWGLVTKMFKDACRSKVRALRAREDNPCLGVEGPDRGTKKLKAYLYPSEFLKLAACESVPLRWRRIFALAVYLYVRAAELRGLEWPDIDLEHLSVMLHRSVDDDGMVTDLKGEEARRFTIEATLLPFCSR